MSGADAGMVPCYVSGIHQPRKKDEIFWLTAARSMEAAASDLGIRLEVIYAERNHLNALLFARQLAERPRDQRPDYLILSNDYGVGPEVLRLLEGTGIRTFLPTAGSPIRVTGRKYRHHAKFIKTDRRAGAEFRRGRLSDCLSADQQGTRAGFVWQRSQVTHDRDCRRPLHYNFA
jgi:hypothetical protein